LQETARPSPLAGDQTEKESSQKGGHRHGSRQEVVRCAATALPAQKNSKQPVFSPCGHGKAARKSTNIQRVIFSNIEYLRHFGAFLDVSQAIEILNK